MTSVQVFDCNSLTALQVFLPSPDDLLVNLHVRPVVFLLSNLFSQSFFLPVT